MLRIAGLIMLYISMPVYSQFSPKKVIIDCDPGVDDAIALILAIESPQLDVIGITTASGNVHVTKGTKNALRIVELTQTDIPVFIGAEEPLYIEPGKPPDYVHGADGLGNVNFPEPFVEPNQKPAACFIAEKIREEPGEITLLAVGRLTNVALALALEPRLTDLVNELVVMGGAVHVPGNVTPVAEANIHGDPHAADIVFTSFSRITMIGLDVTTKVIIDEKYLTRIKQEVPIYGDFISKVSQFYINFYKSTGVNGMYAHDPTAVAYMLNPGLFSTVKAPIRVITDGKAIGETVMAHNTFTANQEPWREKPLINIAVEVDDDEVLNLFYNILANKK